MRMAGLVAATHTPFDANGDLRLDVVETQAAHLAEGGVAFAFIGGTTGESHSLTVAERLALAERWLQATRGTALGVVVHVGGNCLADARTLAAQAERLGAAAIAALSPSYFKPRDVATLVACCKEIAGPAPGTPFYFYDIPSLTGVQLSMPEFLERGAEAIPTLAGIKFTNPDLMAYQLCLRAGGGRFDLPWGVDEYLLAALTLGASGAVGSTYNFAAPLYRRLLEHFSAGDLAGARAEQYRSVELVRLLASRGYMAAAKATMELLGVPVGPPRLPHPPLDARQKSDLHAALDALGFFAWGA